MPLLLVALTVFSYPYAEKLLPQDKHLLDYIFCGLIIIPACLSLRFKHFSIFYFITSSIVIFTLLLTLQKPFFAIDDSQSRLLIQSLTVLLPVNFLLLKILKTPGLFTISSRVFLALLIGEFAMLYWLFTINKLIILEPYLSIKLIDIALIKEGFPQLALLLIIGGLVIQVVQILLKTSSTQMGLLGGLILSSLGVYFAESPFVLATTSLGLSIMLSLTVLQNSYEMAFVDSLTNLPGRRSHEQEMLQLGKRYCIAMLDIDHFKKLNDRYGHDVGDQVLKMVAKQIKTIGGGGKPARYGGEEFAILFSGKSLADVIPHLEVLRLKIAKTPFILRDKDRPKKIHKSTNRRPKNKHQKVAVTISMGAAERNRINRSADIVIKAADKALYKAKKQGRNQVCY